MLEVFNAKNILLYLENFCYNEGSPLKGITVHNCPKIKFAAMDREIEFCHVLMLERKFKK